MIDAQTIIRTVNRAEEAWEGLKVRGELRSRTGPAVSASSAPPAPVDLGMLDLADDVAMSLHGWCRVAHEEGAGDLPADDVPAQAAWMRERAIWIAGAEWAPDMVDELADHARRGVGMLGMLTPRTPLPERCGVCEARQWVWHETPPIVRCREGHESQLVEHLQSRGVETVTQDRAAWVLGIGRSGVAMAVKRGTLDAGVDGGVTVKSLRARLDKAAV